MVEVDEPAAGVLAELDRVHPPGGLGQLGVEPRRHLGVGDVPEAVGDHLGVALAEFALGERGPGRGCPGQPLAELLCLLDLAVRELEVADEVVAELAGCLLAGARVVRTRLAGTCGVAAAELVHHGRHPGVEPVAHPRERLQFVAQRAVADLVEVAGDDRGHRVLEAAQHVAAGSLAGLPRTGRLGGHDGPHRATFQHAVRHDTTFRMYVRATWTLVHHASPLRHRQQRPRRTWGKSASTRPARQACHGLTTSSPTKRTKSRSLRVTTAMPRTMAVAAINALRNGAGSGTCSAAPRPAYRLVDGEDAPHEGDPDALVEPLAEQCPLALAGPLGEQDLVLEFVLRDHREEHLRATLDVECASSGVKCDSRDATPAPPPVPRPCWSSVQRTRSEVIARTAPRMDR